MNNFSQSLHNSIDSFTSRLDDSDSDDNIALTRSLSQLEFAPESSSDIFDELPFSEDQGIAHRVSSLISVELDEALQFEAGDAAESSDGLLSFDEVLFSLILLIL